MHSWGRNYATHNVGDLDQSQPVSLFADPYEQSTFQFHITRVTIITNNIVYNTYSRTQLYLTQ
jgi:hypothetical protein